MTQRLLTPVLTTPLLENVASHLPPRPASARGDQLASRLLESLTLGAELLSIELGHRLGLYRALFELGPANVGAFAAHAGIAERYAREWLEQQAVAGLLDITRSGDTHEREYLLPGAHVPVLLDEVHPLYSVGAAGLLAGIGVALPEVEAAYRSGAGVAYPQYGSALREGIAALNRPSFTHELRSWMGALPQISARLEAGGVILDAGSGLGWSTIALALAFPRAQVVGVDSDTASIVAARANAVTAGVADRVTFVEANVADESTIRSRFHEDYALVTVFEALHDMGEPVRALEAFRGVLAPGGAVMVADERVSDFFTAPAGEVERLQFAISVLHCLPATLAESASVANGTVLRAPTVIEWATEAGFTQVERLTIEHDFWQFYSMS